MNNKKGNGMPLLREYTHRSRLHREGSFSSVASRVTSREYSNTSRENTLASEGEDTGTSDGNATEQDPMAREGNCGYKSPGREGSVSSLRFGTPFLPIAKSDTAWYLEAFGYHAVDAKLWKEPNSAENHPNFVLAVKGSVEMMEHTWYFVQVTLNQAHWMVPRRLCHFREDLLNRLKYEIPKQVYKERFSKAPFARRGGLPGTEERLRAWCAALSECINANEVPPAVVARCLRWVEVPASTTWVQHPRSNRRAESRTKKVASQECTDTSREFTGSSQYTDASLEYMGPSGREHTGSSDSYVEITATPNESRDSHLDRKSAIDVVLSEQLTDENCTELTV